MELPCLASEVPGLTAELTADTGRYWYKRVFPWWLPKRLALLLIKLYCRLVD